MYTYLYKFSRLDTKNELNTKLAKRVRILENIYLFLGPSVLCIQSVKLVLFFSFRNYKYEQIGSWLPFFTKNGQLLNFFTQL